jgi:integrase
MRERLELGPGGEITFGKLVESWRQEIKPCLKASTADYYDKLFGAHLEPRFGFRPLRQTDRSELQRYLSSLGSTYRKNTIRGLRAALGQVFGLAVHNGWLKENPSSSLKLPQALPPRVRACLSEDEVARLIISLDPPERQLVFLIAVTGLRIGEAVALRWCDLKDGRLSVERRIYEGTPDTLKTRTSRCEMVLPRDLADFLEAMRPGPKDRGYIFRTREGTPLWPKNSFNRKVRKAARRLGLELSGWHDFRHTLASWLYERGESPKTAQAILRHADIKTTLQTYTHSSGSQERRAMEEITRDLLRRMKVYPEMYLNQPGGTSKAVN